MWVARDKDGYLALYLLKPIRGTHSWCTMSTYDKENNRINFLVVQLNSGDTPELADMFDNLTWKDEPIEVDLIKICKYTKLTCIPDKFSDICNECKYTQLSINDNDLI